MLDQLHGSKIQSLIEFWKKLKTLFNIRNGDWWDFVFGLKLVQESVPVIEEGTNMKNSYL